MKVKTWIPLALAVVLGLVAAKLVRDSMSKGRKSSDDSKFVATVIVNRDIEPGTKLTAADLAIGKVPAENAPIGVFSDPAVLNDRVVMMRLVKGQTVFENLLAPTGTAAGVQALIPEGMRAITIQVTEFSGLGGMLMPGCKVDVISVIRNDAEKGSVARIIVENVEVRAVGRSISPAAAAAAAEPQTGAPPPAVPNNVTLLVTPEQAEQVQLASIGGSPWLVLRNANDEEPVNSEGTTLADLRGDARRQTEDFPGASKLTSTPTPTEDPFAAGKGSKSASTESASSRTRTIKIIRNGKEEQMTVEVSPAPPTKWLSTQTDGSPATAAE